LYKLEPKPAQTENGASMNVDLEIGISGPSATEKDSSIQEVARAI
jgi:hypothetical protein